MTEPLTDEAVGVLLAQKAELLAFVEERLGSRADAEDLLQAAMLRVVTKGHALRDNDRLLPWFHRLLRNLLVDWYRRRAAADRALRRLADDGATADDRDDRLWSQVCTCVSGVLATLRPEYTEILRRVELDEQPVAQVAGELGISPNNAAVRLFRARRALLKGVHAVCGACAEHGCLDCTCRNGRRAGGEPDDARPPSRGKTPP